MNRKLAIIAFYLFLNPLIAANAQTTVDAGVSINSCRRDTIQLNGLVNDGSTCEWTGGQGTFLPNRNDLHALYVPSMTEGIEGAELQLTLTAAGGGGPVSDVVTLYIDTYSSDVTAGQDQIVCSGDNVSLQAISLLNGIDVGAHYWSIGTGSFTPDKYTLNAVYTPSPLEILSGSFQLSFVNPSKYGTCLPRTDTLLITINSPHMADAGDDQLICETDMASLTGSVSNTSGGTWSSEGDGTFLPDINTLNATYVPGTNDIANGTVLLTLTSTVYGSCSPVSDQVSISIDVCQSTKDLVLSEKFEIYPNPSSGKFTIRSKGSVGELSEISLISPQGKVLYSEKISSFTNSNKSFDFSTFPKGTYLLKLGLKEDFYFKRFLIE